MIDTILINARDTLDWKRRALSDLATLCLWAGWIALWLPVYRKLHQAIGLHLNFGLAAKEVLEAIPPITFLHSALALIGTCLLLLAWSLLPRAATAETQTDDAPERASAEIGLDEADLARGRDSRIAVVHHDEQGRVVAIRAVD